MGRKKEEKEEELEKKFDWMEPLPSNSSSSRREISSPQEEEEQAKTFSLHPQGKERKEGGKRRDGIG